MTLWLSLCNGVVRYLTAYRYLLWHLPFKLGDFYVGCTQNGNHLCGCGCQLLHFPACGCLVSTGQELISRTCPYQKQVLVETIDISVD
jgi:hypothetical protein